MVPILIPAYEPDKRLTKLLKELTNKGIGPIIIVDDGSGERYQEIFSEAERIISSNGGTIIIHDNNSGKGRALKTGFSYIINNFNDEVIGVITADSDGQHTPVAIEGMCNALNDNPSSIILGVRKFDGEHVPWKSRIGNTLTERLFSYIAGVHISDTQTGLRGIPKSLLKESIEIKGERFEYEMRMLVEFAGKHNIVELPIETVYDSTTNHQTHFNPVKDSIRIYRILFEKFIKYLFSSGFSCLIDLLLFYIVCVFLKNRDIFLYTAYATIMARVVSAVVNFSINYKIVFKSMESKFWACIKYFLLALFQMFSSAFLVTICTQIISDKEIVWKILVDTLLFVFSYYVQQRFVFKRMNNK